MSEPRKVAVLGGGAGALAAAFELTAADDWRERFSEVTVYTPGWRLGGKGASGRNAERADRIEEHGLHVWFGFYNEAFWLLGRAYEALKDEAPAKPWTDAFSPIDRLVLWDRDGDELRPWELALPAAKLDPKPAAPADPGAATTRRLHELWHAFLDDLGDAEEAIPGALQLALAVAEASPADDLPALRETARLLRLAVGAQHAAERVLPGDPPFELRRLNRLLDFWSAVLTGIVDDDVLRPPGSFDPEAIARLDEIEFREWLRPRTRFEDTLDMSFVRVLYDLAFAYEDGDPERPNVAAGMALENLFRILFQHGGSMMLRMEGGMGDVVFAPLYRALRERGVRFRFFHHVTRLGLADDKRAVETIEVIEQARVLGGEYEPLLDVEGELCWPSSPRWDRLEEADRDTAVDFERDPDPLGRGTTTMRRGTDFDAVVLGVPVGALPDMCGELGAANPRFGEMLASSGTVATQALQLWLAGDAPEPGLAPKRPAIAGGLTKPFDTYCDMTHLVHREQWPAGSDLGQIAYLCGTLHEPSRESLSAVMRGVTGAAEETVQQRVGDASLIGPDGRSGGTVADQYVRVNTSPGERYVLTTAGSVKHRLAPAESGFENLVLAGDWTRTTINAGSVEAAVQSGRIAAAALMADGAPPTGPLRAGARPYVEYGGLTNAPGPLLCAGTTLYGFWARCDRDRLRALCRQVLNEPTGGAVRATPLLDHAVITFGVIENITPQTPPFDRMGHVTERHAAVWVPIRLRGPEGTPQIGVFLPYLWLDDPISIASGREVYGYAKNWGEPRFAGDGRRRMPPPGTPKRFQLDTWSIRSYGTGEHPGLNRLMEVNRAGLLGTVADWLKRDNLGDLLDTARAAADMLGFAREEVADLGDSLDAVRSMLRSEVNQVFLRQFRDPAGGGASQLQVVCAPARVTPGSFKAKVLGPHKLSLSPLDSHPLGAQMGIQSGGLGPCFRVTMDFTVDTGRVIWGR